jgi:tripartite-type tricarboxylate transporter receptor subunit TctC
MRWIGLVAGLFAIVGAIASPAAAQERAALVIGNGRYIHAAGLPNPANDARAVAATLREMGFAVVSGTDLDRSGMERALFDFLDKARAAKIALVFYAGHGLQVEGRNYLAPVDARLESARDLAFGMIELDKVLASLDEPGRANIVILDACRDNPLARSFASKARSGAVGAGLAAYTSLGTGTLIAFATAPDKVALDGEGANSPFTQGLIKHLRTPGLEVRQMLTRVRADVARATNDRQVPWDNSSLRGDVYLAGAASDAARLQQPQPPSEAERVWALTKDTTSQGVLDAFIARFPGTVFADLARARLAELRGRETPAQPSNAPPPSSSSTASQVAALPLSTPPSVAPTPIPGGAYPTRPVTMIVPFAPGGPTDMVGRLVGQKLGDALGQPIIIVNNTGAGGTIGAGVAAKAAADGHTLLLASSAVFSINPSLYQNLPYDPRGDFVPVGIIASSMQVLVATSKGVASISELIAQAKSKPGSLSYASSGLGTLSHLAGAQFAAVAAINVTHVPYRGTPVALNDLIAGQVNFMFADAASVLPLIKAGTVRAIAVAGPRRHPALPNVPTVAEAGFRGAEAVQSYGLVAPKNTPAAVIAKLNAALRNAIVDPSVRAKLVESGLEPLPGTPEDYSREIAQETTRWPRVIRDAGIKLN